MRKEQGTATARVGTEKKAEPKPALKMVDAIAIIVGIVVGAGIFRTPSLVAGYSETTGMFLSVWVLGGLVSIIGALCYAELTTTFPDTGGDYYYLSAAFGKKVGFLFAWARMSVVQTGSIALLAFITGDYLSQIYHLGDYSSGIYGALVVISLTGINLIGINVGIGAQKLLTTLEVLGVLLITVIGLFFAPEAGPPDSSAGVATSSGSIGMAMVFVLLTFGGWNEAAYVSAELKPGKKSMAMALLLGIVVITLLYLLVNIAYLKVLGLQAMGKSEAVASDVMRLAFGEVGVLLIGVLVAVSALTSANATIFTGARTNYALGRDFTAFRFMGKWHTRASAPVNAFIVQGLISLALLGLGLFTRKGFETIIEYTAPVFWLFFLLVGVALVVLRKKFPDRVRPFKVPFYPITPLVFCLMSAYLLYSSLVYTGFGALVGVGVLLSGVVVLLFLPVSQTYTSRPFQPADTTLPEK